MTESADSAAFWEDLKELIANVVEEMNRLEEFRSKTGGLDYQLGETDSIIVIKQSLPSMSITISSRPDALELESRILGGGTEPIESTERLSLARDANNASFSTETGDVLTLEETVYYILRPFLHLNSVAGRTAARRSKA
jgi:hypothetical protein